MVSSARPTPHPKRHLDRFSRFSTARGYVYSHSHAPCNIANNIKAAPLCMRCILWEQWAAHSDGESPRGHRIMLFVSPSKHYWLKYQRTHAQTNGQAENMMPPRPTRSATKASIQKNNRRLLIRKLYTQPLYPTLVAYPDAEQVSPSPVDLQARRHQFNSLTKISRSVYTLWALRIMA